MRLKDGSRVVTCPNRMYADNYQILRDVASMAFGGVSNLVSGGSYASNGQGAEQVVVFGHGWGKELRLPKKGGRGSYFVDWILARVTAAGEVADFTAIEVQTIDTTGTYRPEAKTYLAGREFVGWSNGNLNWENVNKRILPQIIYKGNVLRREKRCSRGMYFVCPTSVHDRIMTRLGSNLMEYGMHPGSLTFAWYDLGESAAGEIAPLKLAGTFTTTIDQVANSFVAPTDLPEQGVYENALNEALRPT